ncbi:MAG TPA: carboxypeptidase-like regulatory domain-containing protein, partial [Bacteroidales bacterium]|nr:carboxypeptidase-like regulatory domain-containing protein [Bacteroidales bacterium]
MNSKTFILLAIGIFYLSLNVYAQKTYTVQGTVLDVDTNQPVQNAQVWLYGIQAGDVTDSLGHYKFEAFKTYSETRMYVRLCGDDITESKLVSFGTDSLIQTEFAVNTLQSD